MAKGKSKAKSAPSAGLPRGWGEFLGIAFLAIGALMYGGLFSYQFDDGTLMGPVGRLVAGALYAGFGMASYLIVLGVIGVGFKALVGQRMELRIGEGLGFTVATLAGCVLLHVTFPEYRVHGYTAGGLTGELLGEVCLGMFDSAGTYLICIAALCLGLLASTPLSTKHLLVGGHLAVRGVKTMVAYLWEGAVGIVQTQREAWVEERDAADEYEEEYEDEDEDEEYEEEDEEAEYEEEEDEEEEEEPAPKSARSKSKSKAKSKAKADCQVHDAIDMEEAEEEDEAPKRASKSTAKAPVSGSNKPRKNKRIDVAAEEDDLPEIVIPEPAPEAVAETKGNASGKKAPPKPAELAAAARKAAANGVANTPGPKVKKAKNTVQYLKDSYDLPPLQLFEAAEKEVTIVDRDFVYGQADRIVEALAHFKIKGKVTKVHPGPVVTRYEFKPEAGTKLSKIANLENDLAMALEAIRIRILAPIPGKNTVGFEVPNKVRETVFVSEILEDAGFADSGKAKLPLALGRDITGKAISIDMAKAPHLLVAGATGAGKSVGVNSMICSLLHTCTPEELRMILIDPKRLEFALYEDVPHLLLPVITDAEKANNALKWAVNEMERRYTLLSEAKVRDLAGYNNKVPQLQDEWEADKRALERVAEDAAQAVSEDGEDAVPGSQLSGVSFDAQGQVASITGGEELPERPAKLPFLVIIIDEFADLMMVASKEVEANVARIAAKARAAGVHLIVATQRPSVDVITGTIKNNFPSRIAFQVTSDIDSRTILDQNGAKQLLGMGDMLYMDRGKEPTRVHGCFVSEREIEKVVEFIKKQAKPAYNLEITKQSDSDAEDDEQELPKDPLYDKAVRLVGESQKCSTSMLQRRLGIGYGRAAKIVDMMEAQGVVGPAQGAMGKREIYVSAA